MCRCMEAHSTFLVANGKTYIYTGVTSPMIPKTTSCEEPGPVANTSVAESAQVATLNYASLHKLSTTTGRNYIPLLRTHHGKFYW